MQRSSGSGQRFKNDRYPSGSSNNGNKFPNNDRRFSSKENVDPRPQKPGFAGKPRSDNSKANSKKTFKTTPINNTLKVSLRPDKGNEVDPPVQVVTNCWDLKFKCIPVYMYNIELKSAIIDQEKKVEIRITHRERKAYLKILSEKFGKFCVDDGGSIIYSLEKFPNITKESKNVTESINDESDRVLKLNYNIIHAATLTLDSLLEFTKGGAYTSSLDLPQDAVRVLDTFFRFICSKDLINTRHNAFFYQSPVTTVPQHLYGIYRGFCTSIRPQWKVRLNVDMICKAFFSTGYISDVLYNKYGDGMYNRQTWKSMENDILGVRVTADHYKNESNGKSFSRRFTCFGLSKGSSDETIISDLNQSVSQYFKTTYGVALKYGDLPCVKVSKAKDTFIPMELLDVVPFQEPTCSASDVSSQVVRSAAIKPIERFNQLDRFVSSIVSSFKHPKIKQFEFELGRSKVDAVGRTLPQPRFGQSKVVINRGSWKQDSFEYPAMSGLKISWAILSVGNHPAIQKHTKRIKDEMVSVGRQFSMNFDANPHSKVVNKNVLKKEVYGLKNSGVKMLVFVLYDKFAYGEIKRLCDLEAGIVTQCIAPTTVEKRFVFQNLLLKINGKLGGMNWTVPSMKPQSERIMVFGMDVTHPSPQQRHVEKSIYAVVGSTTTELMRYNCIVGYQDTSRKGSNSIVEVISNLENVIKDLILSNAKSNGGLPDRLIFYRDGVSEGQFKDVLLKELLCVQRACTNIKPDYAPAITYIVVQKRHNIRFMTKNNNDNVVPGTVVDVEITNPKEFDFYLCSHFGLQGTSKPAHYYVLYDDSDWNSASLQRFTYCLCHAYMRCSKAVSIPAPTYYSHLAAFRAREWVKGNSRFDDLVANNRFKLHSANEGWMFFL